MYLLIIVFDRVGSLLLCVAFSSCDEQGLRSIAVRGLLVASRSRAWGLGMETLTAARRLIEHRL